MKGYVKNIVRDMNEYYLSSISHIRKPQQIKKQQHCIITWLHMHQWVSFIQLSTIALETTKTQPSIYDKYYYIKLNNNAGISV